MWDVQYLPLLFNAGMNNFQKNISNIWVAFTRLWLWCNLKMFFNWLKSTLFPFSRFNSPKYRNHFSFQLTISLVSTLHRLDKNIETIDIIILVYSILPFDHLCDNSIQIMDLVQSSAFAIGDTIQVLKLHRIKVTRAVILKDSSNFRAVF